MKQNQTQKNETESNETKQNRIRFDTIKMDAIKITRNMTNDITQWCEFIESDGKHTLEKNIRFLDRPDRKSTMSDNNLIYNWNAHQSYPLNEDELRKFTHKQGHKTPSRTEYYIMMRCKRCKFVTSYILKFQPSRYPTVFSPCKRCFVGYPLLSKWVDLASGGKARIKEDFDTFHKNNYGSSGGNTSFSIECIEFRHDYPISRISNLTGGECISQMELTPEEYVGNCQLCLNNTNSREELLFKISRKGQITSTKFGLWGENLFENVLSDIKNINNKKNGIHFHLVKSFEGGNSDFVLSLNIKDPNGSNNINCVKEHDLFYMPIQVKTLRQGHFPSLNRPHNSNTIMVIVVHEPGKEEITTIYVGRYDQFVVSEKNIRNKYKISLTDDTNYKLQCHPSNLGVFLLKNYLELAERNRLISYWSSIRPWKDCSANDEFNQYQKVVLGGLQSKYYSYKYNPNYQKIDNYLIVYITKDAIKLIDPLFIRWICKWCNGMNHTKVHDCTYCKLVQDESSDPFNTNNYESDYIVACFKDQAKSTIGTRFHIVWKCSIDDYERTYKKKSVPYLIAHNIDGFNLHTSDGYSYLIPSNLVVNEGKVSQYRTNIYVKELESDFSNYKYKTKEGVSRKILCEIFSDSGSDKKLEQAHMMDYKEPSIQSTEWVNIEEYLSDYENHRSMNVIR